MKVEFFKNRSTATVNFNGCGALSVYVIFYYGVRKKVRNNY